MPPKLSHNKLDRAQIFARKWIDGFIQGLHPSAISGRFAGPKIFINSVPKAGTHLLETTLSQFPQLRFSGRPTVIGWSDADLSGVIRAISSIKCGTFRSGHTRFWPELQEPLRRTGVKVIQVIRDPRDIIVSQWKYVTQIDMTHKEGKALREIKNTDTLLAMIEGIPAAISSIEEVWMAHKGWLSLPGIMIVRFEDLIGEKGGGTGQQQLSLLEKLAGYLDLDADTTLLIRVAEGLFSEKSATFRQGKTGAWRKVLQPQHKMAFKHHLGPLLVDLGYEKNQNW